jgi:hypothetical protein
VCGSAHGSVRVVRLGKYFMAVRAAVCDCAAVRQCVAVCPCARGSEQQCGAVRYECM